MRMTTKAVMLIFSAFVGYLVDISAVYAVNPPEAKAIVGSAAPQFELTSYEGKKHSLNDYKGKYVVLEWFNNKCPFVVKHYKSNNMQGLQKKYTEKGVIWLTIVSSAEGKQGYLTPEMSSQVKSEWNMAPTDMLVDASGMVGRLYGAKTTPHMYIINPEGKLVYAGAIDNNNSSDADDIPTSVNYVSTALDQAMSGGAIVNASTEPYGCSVKYAG